MPCERPAAGAARQGRRPEGILLGFRGSRTPHGGDRRSPIACGGPRGGPLVRSALGCAALGLLLLVVAGTFDAEPLYVTGAALLLLGAGALAWIGIGGHGAKLSREIGVRSVIEEQPLQVKLLARSG